MAPCCSKTKQKNKEEMQILIYLKSTSGDASIETLLHIAIKI
jgi:hypothetical protein